MKFRAMRVRIGRLVVEHPAGEGLTASALSEAVQSQLLARMRPGTAVPSAALQPARTVAPLAGAVADSIAGKLRLGARR